MTDEKISQLTATTTIADADLLTTVQGGINKKITGSSVKTQISTWFPNPLLYKGNITLPANFPTLATVQTGWLYEILADVTDNDVTKTNTGQSFVAGDQIFWNGTNWYTAAAAENLFNRIVEGLGFKLNQHNALDNLDFSSAKGYLKAPSGTTLEQPTPANAMFRYNTTTNLFEFYQGGAWVNYLTDAAENLWDRAAEGLGFKLTQHTAADNLDLSSATGYLKVPAGITTERLTGANGMIRYNSTTSRIEFYEIGDWQNYLTEAAENLWDRVGATLQPHTANDNVNIGSGTFTGASIIADILTEKTPGNGVVVPTGIVLKQQTYTAPTADVHYITKKYADDLFATGLLEHYYWAPYHDPITAGRTAFTLSVGAINPELSILTVNGVQQPYAVDGTSATGNYKIIGTALTWLGTPFVVPPDQTMEIWYNIDSTGYVTRLDEKQIYYINDNGDDSNNGKSVNTPVKTIAQAITLVNAQVPSSSNRFEIQIIGAGIYTENFTLPVYTTLVGLGATLNSVIILRDYSKIDVKHIAIPASTSTGVTANAAIDPVLKCDIFTTGSNVSTAILASGSSSLHVDIQSIFVNNNCIVFGASSFSNIYAKVTHLNAGSFGSSIASIVISSSLYLTGSRIFQDTSPYHDSTSQYYITANNYEKSPFVARTIVDVPNFCGDNGTYVVPLAYTTEYNGEVMNKGAYYNTSTYKVSYPFSCLVDFRASILLKNITASAHTYGELAILVYNASDVLQQAYILDLKNINNTAGPSPIAPSNALVLNGSADVVMPDGYYAQLVVLVEGSTKEITLNGSSLAGSRFSGTIKQIL
jgi:hypothetical protein